MSYTFSCATCAVDTAVTAQIECTMCPALVCTGCARVDRAWIHDRRFCEPCSHRYLPQEGDSTESGDSGSVQLCYRASYAPVGSANPHLLGTFSVAAPQKFQTFTRKVLQTLCYRASCHSHKTQEHRCKLLQSICIRC